MRDLLNGNITLQSAINLIEYKIAVVRESFPVAAAISNKSSLLMEEDLSGMYDIAGNLGAYVVLAATGNTATQISRPDFELAHNVFFVSNDTLSSVRSQSLV